MLKLDIYENIVLQNRPTMMMLIINLSNQLFILAQISGLSLVVLGTMILTDTKLTGQEVNGLFVFIYILGVNFRNIIDGFGIAMIVLGSIAFILNSLAIISDVILQSKTKSKLVSNATIHK